MKKHYLILIIILNIFMALLPLGCMTNDTDDIVVIDDSETKDMTDASSKESEYKIYLITMDLADDFWQSIDSGCRQAVEEIGGINYKWIGPDTHEDEYQKVCIDQAVKEGANAIVMASSSLTGINDSLQKAKEAGVKIIFVDNAANFDYVAFLATDNELAGKIAAETMQKALSEAGIKSGTIGIMVNKESVISTSLRVKGFREIFEDTAFKLDDTFYMEDEPQRIKNFIKEHPDYIAFFGSNERTALAIGEQIRDSGSKQIVVGFDTSDAVLALLNEGVLYATLQQNPKRMGHDGMEIAVKALKGTYTDKNIKIDTGVNVIYKDSM